ncbi:MAG: hypothetical protein LBP59_02670 [Planctomycetaceae bacterium]|jgi:hypothetical protein|nr:hypothetical protein [Planctomycetaceae bacterium]
MSLLKSEATFKFRVANKYFSKFTVSFDEKFIDVIVEPNADGLFAPFLWAESKKNITDVSQMFAQLLLTIKPIYDSGKKNLPKYLGVFDKEKIVFVEFYHLLPIFLLSDFNWNEKPSSVSRKTENTVAKFLYPQPKSPKSQKQKLDQKLDQIVVYEFNFAHDDSGLREFIKSNFTFNGDTVKLQITKNNFLHVYNRWVAEVRPSIVASFDTLQEYDLIDGDFYLADLLSEDNESVMKSLKVSLRQTVFHVNIRRSDRLFKEEIRFCDKGRAHDKFWSKYERPPAKEYWDYMIDRRDLLVPQEIRERKGSFFTPKIWVEKSQEYLEKAFGEHWQDEYIIWDCCCGTGNLLVGLTNPDNIWASTIDQPDVEVLNELIDGGHNLWKNQVFQFDFLNDEFKPVSDGGKIPDKLFKIINSTEKQKRLIIYMNPPYAEHGNKLTIKSHGKNKSNVARTSAVYTEYQPLIGTAAREIFAQFFIRIKQTLPNAKLASFSTLKYVNAQNFSKFRNIFRAKYKCGFICKASTFDNVSGQFPIGFLIWDFEQPKKITRIQTDVLVCDGGLVNCRKEKTKNFYAVERGDYIIDWLRNYYDKSSERIGFFRIAGVDMQHNSHIFITLKPSANDIKESLITNITPKNLIETSIYLAVRQVFEHTWENDRDQFLYPNDGFKKDKQFQNNCLIYALFHSQNKVSANDGVNHWIPFRAKEVKAKSNFESDFMYKFLCGRNIIPEHLASSAMTSAAHKVLSTGKLLWTYYQETIKSDGNANVNASLYNIREYFKKRNPETNRINAKAIDQNFNELDQELKNALKSLAEQIKPKTYEYRFLQE